MNSGFAESIIASSTVKDDQVESTATSTNPSVPLSIAAQFLSTISFPFVPYVFSAYSFI